MRKLIWILTLLAFASMPLGAQQPAPTPLASPAGVQSAAPSPTPTAWPTPLPEVVGTLIQTTGSTPKPWDNSEIPPWLRVIRRGEIIAAGIFPFMLLASSFGYDVYRYGLYGFDQRYAPAPFGIPGGDPKTDSDKLGILGITVGLSLVFAIIDGFLSAPKIYAEAQPGVRP